MLLYPRSPRSKVAAAVSAPPKSAASFSSSMTAEYLVAAAASQRAGNLANPRPATTQEIHSLLASIW